MREGVGWPNWGSSRYREIVSVLMLACGAGDGALEGGVGTTHERADEDEIILGSETETRNRTTHERAYDIR